MADTVLVVEDEGDVVDLLRYNPHQGGFSPCSLPADGLTGLEMARKSRPDVIVLDLMLPEMDGYSCLQRASKDPRTPSALPILMLTARGEPSERVHGLEIGADDYVTKPFSPRELVFRVQALLRRSRSQAPAKCWKSDDFQLG